MDSVFMHYYHVKGLILPGSNLLFEKYSSGGLYG